MAVLCTSMQYRNVDNVRMFQYRIPAYYTERFSHEERVWSSRIPMASGGCNEGGYKWGNMLNRTGKGVVLPVPPCTSTLHIHCYQHVLTDRTYGGVCKVVAMVVLRQA